MSSGSGERGGTPDDARRRRDERTLADDEETLVPGAADARDDVDTIADAGGGPARPDGPDRTLAEDEETLAPQSDQATIAGPLPTDDRDTIDIPPPPRSVPQRTIAEDEATIAGPAPTERRSRGMETARGDGTVVGDFAGTEVAGARPATEPLDADDGEEGETVFEPGLAAELTRKSSPNVTQRDPGAGTPRRRSDARATGAGASATQRDPAAEGYTQRGGHIGTQSGPIRLEERFPLANRYILKKRLGKGGMGEVWRATHNLLEGDRAIKVIKANISRDPQFRKRFLKEGQTMMRVKHPGVVEVTDLDELRETGELFMVMQHLEGRTLYDAIRDDEAPLGADVRNVARIYRELALGMQRIHDVRIVHKDLKSDNALLVKGDDGLEHPKVIDFGLAKSLDDDDAAPDTHPADDEVDGNYDPDLRTTLSGTLAYMAPEQFMGRPSSFQSDIYAFGVMLFETFQKGGYPMQRGGLADYITMHADGVKPALLRTARPDLDPFIAELSDRCMAPRRADRPESFNEVAEQLQWWLDAPERARKRKQLIGLVSGAVFLIAVAVAGFFFGEKTASLSDPQISVAGRPLSPALDKSVHLRDDMLANLELVARVTGEPKDPLVEVDGERVAAETREDAGRLVAAIDLSDLADGKYEVLFFASAGAAPASLDVVVDRKAPGVTAIQVPEARGEFSNAPAPQVRVQLDETNIASVVARVDGVSKSMPGNVASEDGPRDVWLIAGTAQKDGEVAMDVEVRDFAGNVSNRRFRYVWDQQLADPVVRDLVVESGRLPVRSGVGAKVGVSVAEPARIVLTPEGGAAVERAADAAGLVELDLPAISGPLAATLHVEDRAGNVFERSISVEVQTDKVEIVTLEDKSPQKVIGAGVREISLLFRRTYALATPAAVLATRIRDAEGNTVREQGAELAASFGSAVPPFGVEMTLPRTELSEGTWLLTPTGQGAASAAPFELTIDTTSPRLSNVIVRDEDGHEVPRDGWSHSRRVSVEVIVSDVSLKEIALDGASPATGPFAPGSTTRRFDVTFPADGPNESGITLTDAAGNPARTELLTIRTDATDPALEVDGPRNGEMANDRDGVRVAGRVGNEANYKVHVLVPGSADAAPQEIDQAFDSAEFEIAGVRPPVGMQTLEIWATDDSGRTSPRRRVTVEVKKLAVELPTEFDWESGVTSRMQKIEPSDIQIGGRMFPVHRVYVDRTEVTNAQYRAFLAATGGKRDLRWSHPGTPEGWSHTPPAETWADPRWSADTLPVVNVAYWDAYAFAKWSERRLPTEAEWVKAAVKREGDPDLLRWPFGNTWEDGVLVTREALTETAFQGPVDATVGSDSSPLECLHMGGNVSEWVDLEREPEGNPTTAVRGGNWYLSAAASNVRDVPAKRYDRSQRHATIGFRCVAESDDVRSRLGSVNR